MQKTRQPKPIQVATSREPEALTQRRGDAHEPLPYRNPGVHAHLGASQNFFANFVGSPSYSSPSDWIYDEVCDEVFSR